MQLRFVHAADIHLGYEQYNLTERANDFARAYLSGVVAHSLETRPDFVLIAGDLFHRANADAWTLRQAMAGLEQLRLAGIPVIAIEGNHDAQQYHKNLSWMEFLCDQELLVLLNLDRTENGYRSLPPFDPDSRRGAWIDIAGARIYGIKYLGAALPRVLEEVAGEIEPGEFTIMMLHAGLEGQVPHMHGGLSLAQLAPLRGRADYVALGHVHKRVTVEDWIFNPGSTEINSFEEIDWPHGFFEVQVDTSAPQRFQVTPIATPTLRPFRRISVLGDGCASTDAFVQRVEEKISATADIPEQAVIELHLGGMAEFRRQDVPLEHLKGVVETRFRPLVTRVTNVLAAPGTVHADRHQRLSRTDLEQQVIERLVYQQAEYREAATQWTKLILGIKNMAIEGNQAADIVDHLRAGLEHLTAEAIPPMDDTVPPAETPAPELEAPLLDEVTAGELQFEFEDW